MTEVKIQLKTLMANIFECDLGDIDNHAQINETIGWDSLSHINLALAIGGEGIDISPMDIPELTSYEKIKTFLTNKGCGVDE